MHKIIIENTMQCTTEKINYLIITFLLTMDMLFKISYIQFSNNSTFLWNTTKCSFSYFSENKINCYIHYIDQQKIGFKNINILCSLKTVACWTSWINLIILINFSLKNKYNNFKHSVNQIFVCFFYL